MKQLARLLALLSALAAFSALWAGAVTASQATASDAGATNYIVVFNNPNAIPAGADQAVAEAGGTITTRIEQIGSVGAASSNPNFIAEIEASPVVHSASVDVVMDLIPEGESDVEPLDAENNGGTYGPPGPDPQPMPDSLGREQWDKMRMNATSTGSYAVQQGRREVVVAVLDTGADVLPQPHPDIAPNLDFARSAAFVTPAGGTLPVPDHNPASWDDRHGHGSWCLSAVGAPINSIGVSGVAPRITLVALKVLGDTGSGTFLGVANALVYAGVNKFDVASMSLGGYLRHADHVQAIVTVVQRAVQFARQNGVLPVAALANNGADLSDGSFFRDFIETPGELPGVVGLSATGYYNQKAHYSNYGVGKTDVSAPGGSTRDYTGVPGTGTAPGYRGMGRVVGAWSTENTGGVTPPDLHEECDVASGQCAIYAWVQGTSMATPNAAGVAALIISQYGEPALHRGDTWYMAPTSVESTLQITANNQPCPEPRTVRQGPGVGFVGAPFEFATCEGDTGYNSFFGKGIADALNAVTFYNQR